jgi:hypothetical protein
MRLSAAWQIAKVLVRLRFMASFHSDSGMSATRQRWIRPPMLANRTSISPIAPSASA